MAKYHRRRREKPMSKEEKVAWIITCVVFVVCFVAYFIYGFFSNCIFHWPIRWDIGTCWHEQIQPAQNKAAESASNFMP